LSLYSFLFILLLLLCLSKYGPNTVQVQMQSEYAQNTRKLRIWDTTHA